MKEEITHKDNITGNILTNKITHEDNITGEILTDKVTHAENFDLVEGLQTYNNFKELRNNKAYKLMSENNVDTNELLGIDKEPEAGTIQIKDRLPKLIESQNIDFAEAFLELGEDLKSADVMTSVFSRVPEGLINAADFGTNILQAFDKLFVKLDSNYESTDIFKNFSENLDKAKNYFKEQRKDVEGKTADLAGIILQDAPAIAALYPVFSKFMPKTHAAALSFGVGYAVSWDEEHGASVVPMFSEHISSFKRLIKILPDTPEDKLVDDIYQAFEGTSLAALIPGIAKGFKFIKNNLSKETVSDLAKITAGGAVIAGTDIY